MMPCIVLLSTQMQDTKKMFLNLVIKSNAKNEMV